MNTLDILFVLPLLIIFSYLFDAFARKTKFPSVILLMATGIIVRFLISFSGYDNFEFLDNLIPVLGTIGLILIVLEGAIELEITREKLPLIVKGFFTALVILVGNIYVLQFLFQRFFEMDGVSAVLFAIPLAIISSAVAIPSASSLLQLQREFVVYESTFSDILGIMIFNYALRQSESQQPLLGPEPMVSLVLQIIGVIVISLVITYVLFRLMQQIDHKVKFFLILALLILVYAFGKVLHLPALVTIFIFGAFLSNVKSLLPPFLRKTLDLKTTEKELHEFHILTAESTFLVRTFFFLFFGFSIQISDFTSPGPLINGLLIFLVMFVLRYVYFTATSLKLKPSPLVYMSPRGLISILLFLQLKEVAFINFEESPIDERMLLIVILSSMLVMLLGTMKKDKKKDIIVEDDETPLSVEMEIEPQSLTEEET
ncbi:cation:proton antiporter [Flavobacteriaceae bacterium]|jgi:NhaP-type Na+/H+ or K+/H+ antiporter|nr:cation:proton antiporter [Flavobacteriaceae bacterium]MDA9038125.1 cation:proton antiporter [Flavobacteriaceae bacterium]MDA9852054.1 cation:proton antiporter [Flavobacteriaceae bacterium]MDC0386019.1 cation:proton antiporter [Flavobacteriaceae bacterium]